MFEHIKRMYLSGKLNKTAVRNAVKKGWISKEQADEIIALSK